MILLGSSILTVHLRTMKGKICRLWNILLGWKLFFVQVIEHLSSSVMGFTITWSWVVHIYEGSHVHFNYEIAKFSIEPLKLFRETENLWDQLVLLLIRSNQKFCLWKSTKQFFTHLFITLPQNPVLLRMDPNTIWDKKPRKHFSTHLGIYLKFQFFSVKYLCVIEVDWFLWRDILQVDWP